MESSSNAKEVVMSYVEALNDQDFKTARTFVSEDLSFSAPLASYNRAEPYFKDMERLRLKFEVKKIFVDGNDVCLLYDFSSGQINLFGCRWYHVENGKIISLRVLYDPRPIIELSTKK